VARQRYKQKKQSLRKETVVARIHGRNLGRVGERVKPNDHILNQMSSFSNAAKAPWPLKLSTSFPTMKKSGIAR